MSSDIVNLNLIEPRLFFFRRWLTATVSLLWPSTLTTYFPASVGDMPVRTTAIVLWNDIRMRLSVDAWMAFGHSKRQLRVVFRSRCENVIHTMSQYCTMYAPKYASFFGFLRKIITAVQLK